MVRYPVAVGLAHRVGHEFGHLRYRQVRLNVIAGCLHDVEESVYIPCTQDLTHDGLDDFLLVALSGKVTGREEIALTGECQCLLTVQGDIVTGRYIDRIVAALAGRILSDEGNR